VNLQGALTWAFEFEDQPYFAGFRQLASNGIDLPVLNVFRMFARMHGQRVPATSSGQSKLDDLLAQGVRGAPDVGVMASRSPEEIAVLVWHYHDDDVPGPDAQVELVIRGLPRDFSRVVHFRIDASHSNAYAAWQRLGSPIAPDKATWDSLRAAGQLAAMQDESDVAIRRGQGGLSFLLPRQGVALLVFSAAR